MWKFISLLSSSLLVLTSVSLAEVYNVDPVHSQVRFSIPHLVMFKVQGNFTDFTGQIEANAKKKTVQSVKGTIQVDSIDTREPKRDGHLKSPDFFDVKKYPEINFVSKSIQGSGDNIKVKGDITIHGVTKTVVLNGSFLGSIKDAWGNHRAGFEATTTVNRKDFGLNWNKALETGGLVVGDEVQITLEIQGVQTKNSKVSNK